MKISVLGLLGFGIILLLLGIFSNNSVLWWLGVIIIVLFITLVLLLTFFLGLVVGILKYISKKIKGGDKYGRIEANGVCEKNKEW